jgi:hypothetical protein
MKTKLIRFFFLGIIMCSLSLQAFTPPLPPGTTVCVDGLPSCYEAKVSLEGSDVVQMLPRTREWFLTSAYCLWNNGNHQYTISVYTKATSTSPFIYRGSILSSNASVDTNYQENYLYFIDIDYDQLVIPPPE